MATVTSAQATMPRRSNALGVHSLNRFVFTRPGPGARRGVLPIVRPRRAARRQPPRPLHARPPALLGQRLRERRAEATPVPLLCRLRGRLRRAGAARARRGRRRPASAVGRAGRVDARCRRHRDPGRRRAQGVAGGQVAAHAGVGAAARQGRGAGPQRGGAGAAAAAVARAAVLAGRAAADGVLRARPRPAPVRPLGRPHRVHVRSARERPPHGRVREVGGAGPASFELGRRQHRRGRPRRRADARRRATRTAGASAGTCSAPTTSTTCRIRGAAGPSTRTTSTSCPADVEWPAADHPAEDSFYVWGPSVPDDFIVNREQPRAA